MYTLKNDQLYQVQSDWTWCHVPLADSVTNEQRSLYFKGIILYHPQNHGIKPINRLEAVYEQLTKLLSSFKVVPDNQFNNRVHQQLTAADKKVWQALRFIPCFRATLKHKCFYTATVL